MKIKEWLTSTYITQIVNNSTYTFEFKEELLQILTLEISMLNECECLMMI